MRFVWRRIWRLAIFVALLHVAIVASLRLLIGTAKYLLASRSTADSESADAALVLGGEREREEYAVKRLSRFPIPTYISSGSLAEDDPIFDGWHDLLTIDGEAVDTVTNYSTMVDRFFVRHGYQRVLVITCPAHLPRARRLGRLILGARGIATSFETTSACPSDASPESWEKTLRDSLRAISWIAFDLDGRHLSAFLQHFRNSEVPHLR